MLKIFYYIFIPLVILYLVLKNKLIPSATINNMTDKLGISSDGYTTAVNICKKWENLASSEPNKLKYFPIPSMVLDNTKVYAYKDVKGLPTIGWGSIYNQNGGSIKMQKATAKPKPRKMTVNMIPANKKSPQAMAPKPMMAKKGGSVKKKK